MNNTKHEKYAKISVILSMIPIVAFVVTFMFCFITSGGSMSEGDTGTVWWLFIIFF